MVNNDFMRSVVLAISVGAVPMVASAQQVNLTTKDGATSVSGNLIAVENGEYVIQTSMGRMMIGRDSVTCDGAGCPIVAPAVPEMEMAIPMPVGMEPDMQILASGEIYEVLVPILTDAFAQSIDAEVTVMDASGAEMGMEHDEHEDDHGGELNLNLTSFDGDQVALLNVAEGEGAEVFETLARGEAQIVFTDEAVSSEDRRRVLRGGGGDLANFAQERVVAVDGLAIVVNPDNSVPAIRMEQLAQIFAGRITNWAQLGGENAQINLYSFADGSEAFHDIEELVLEPFGLDLTDGANIVESVRELSSSVKRDENGIGVVGFSSTRGNRVVPMSTECGITVSPSNFTIKTEEYPLAHRVFAYNRADVSDIALGFLDNLDGPDLDGLVSKAGFVDQSVMTESGAFRDDRIRGAMAYDEEPVAGAIIQRLVMDMLDTRRLSTTFRFAPGSSILDNKALRDLQRIVNFVEDEQPEMIILAGFADSFGGFDENAALAASRAAAVREQIFATANAGQLDGTDIVVRGYGELGPVACNTDFEGRATNRRVEVWVK